MVFILCFLSVVHDVLQCLEHTEAHHMFKDDGLAKRVLPYAFLELLFFACILLMKNNIMKEMVFCYFKIRRRMIQPSFMFYHKILGSIN